MGANLEINYKQQAVKVKLSKGLRSKSLKLEKFEVGKDRSWKRSTLQKFEIGNVRRLNKISAISKILLRTSILTEIKLYMK